VLKHQSLQLAVVGPGLVRPGKQRVANLDLAPTRLVVAESGGTDRPPVPVIDHGERSSRGEGAVEYAVRRRSRPQRKRPSRGVSGFIELRPTAPSVNECPRLEQRAKSPVVEGELSCGGLDRLLPGALLSRIKTSQPTGLLGGVPRPASIRSSARSDEPVRHAPDVPGVA
jgi:hypothetical protein